MLHTLSLDANSMVICNWQAGTSCLHIDFHLVSEYRERKSRDLVLALVSTGDFGWFYACVENRVTFCVWCAHCTDTKRCKLSGFKSMKIC